MLEREDLQEVPVNLMRVCKSHESMCRTVWPCVYISGEGSMTFMLFLESWDLTMLRLLDLSGLSPVVLTSSNVPTCQAEWSCGKTSYFQLDKFKFISILPLQVVLLLLSSVSSFVE